MPATVLIASPEHLSALQRRDDLGDVLAFSDTDALRALDTITRQRPQVVALERLFASTSRGTAMINRIKARGTLQPEQLVDTALDLMGPMEVGEGTRQELLTFAREGGELRFALRRQARVVRACQVKKRSARKCGGLVTHFTAARCVRRAN